MNSAEQITALQEIQAGINLAKCQKCGCMRETLNQIKRALPELPEAEIDAFSSDMPVWLANMKPLQYECLGCEHCFAGSAQNAFTNAFPQVAGSFGLSCEIQENAGTWPPVIGEYIVVDADALVSVVTLASLDLPRQIADRRPEGLSITGKLETENIGVDKLIKNVIANPHLRCLVIAGGESFGHQSGQTLVALAEYGIEPKGRVIGSHGKRPVLRNVNGEEWEPSIFPSTLRGIGASRLGPT